MLDNICQENLGKIVLEHGMKKDELNRQYPASLRNLQKSVQQSGNLAKVKAVMAEIARFAEEKTVADEHAAERFPGLRALQLSYVKRGESLRYAKAHQVLALTKKYDDALAKLQRDLTKRGNIDA